MSGCQAEKQAFEGDMVSIKVLGGRSPFDVKTEGCFMNVKPSESERS